MMPSRTIAGTLPFLMISSILSGNSREIMNKHFSKTDMTDPTIHLSGYNQIKYVSRKLDCAKQCSQDDACADFYYTSLEDICYLNGASSSNVYTIQTANFAFYTLNIVSVGCPVNEGGWFVLEEDSNIMFSLFTTTAAVTLQEAVDHCASLNAHPLQIQTVDKMNFVRDQLVPCADVNGHHYWIDATNALASDPSAWDAFRTSDNKVFPISDGSSWHNGVGPDNGNIQPLCIWIPTFFSYKLDDIACYSPSTSIKHICEKPKP